jgi:two-component sensor histidine kinase
VSIPRDFGRDFDGSSKAAIRPRRETFDREDTMTEVARERMLLHEFNHRINNEFAAAISSVSLAARCSNNDEVKAALSGVVELLHQYADVNRALQMPECDMLVDAATYLRQLCRSITRSRLEGRKISLVLAAQPLRLPADHCWRLGMIVFELINNAARHAFSDGEGEIRAELLWADPFVECTIMDNGSASGKVQPGHGLKIVDALSKDLHGQFEQKFGSQGSMATLVFPATVSRQRPSKSEGDGVSFSRETACFGYGVA